MTDEVRKNKLPPATTRELDGNYRSWGRGGSAALDLAKVTGLPEHREIDGQALVRETYVVTWPETEREGGVSKAG